MSRRPLRGAALALLCAATAAARPLRVDVDPRVELAGAVDWLAAPKSTSAPDAVSGLPYARELANRLPAPSSPELTAATPTWTADGRARLMLSLSPLPGLERLGVEDDADVAGAGGSAALDRRLAALRAYARDSRFEAAFKASRSLLDGETARLRRRLDDEAPLKAFEKYARLDPPERTLVLLSPFSEPGPAPGRVDIEDDGKASLTVVVGPHASTAAPTVVDFWSDRLPATLWNETAQLQLEPLAQLYAGRIAQSSRLAGPDERCAHDWARCALDQVARAVMLRLTERRYGKKAAEALRQTLEQGGTPSPVLTGLLASLERYETDQRLGLADYFPELLASMPLDDPSAAPAPPQLPPAADLSTGKRRRLAAFLKAAARHSRDARLKSLAAAAREWARAPELAAPVFAVPVSSSAAEGDRQRGLQDFSAGRPEAALADFQAALSSAPGDAQTLASEAAVLATLGRDDEALAAYDSALAAARAARADGAPLPLEAELLKSREEARRRLAAKTRKHFWQ